MPGFLSHKSNFNFDHNGFHFRIAHLVDSTCLRQVPALLKHVEGCYERHLLLLDAIHIALSAGLLLFAAKCTAYVTEHVDIKVFAYSTHKKYMCPSGYTWVMREHGVGNLLAFLAAYSLEYQLVLLFQLERLIIMPLWHLLSSLEPSFLFGTFFPLWNLLSSLGPFFLNNTSTM